MTTSTSSTQQRPSADQAAVAALPGRLVEVWAAHDADGFADLFTEDGTLILPGIYLNGREALRGFMTEAFKGPYKGTRVTGQPLNLRFLDTDVAILLTEGGVIAAGETELSDAAAIRASWLVVRRDGQWRLAAYQNSPRDPK